MSGIRTRVAGLKRRTQSLAWDAGHTVGFGRSSERISFVAEPDDWSIRWDGLYITREVNRIKPGIARVICAPAAPIDSVVHFGSQYMWAAWAPLLSTANRYVVTYFHGKPEDGPAAAKNLEDIIRLLPRTERVVTSASHMESRLLGWGVPRDKLVRIPIGVDTRRFAPPASDRERRAAKSKYGVPEDRLCIGSFQKDGVGWGEGTEPKLIKGPDVFLAAVEDLSRQLPIFVLLTGPARGYVKKGLERMGIPYRHVFLKDYLDIVSCYHALDLYLMTSREEGGPKSIMESMATEVPIVATRCGMAEDLIVDGENGALASVGDAESVVNQALHLLEDKQRLAAMRARARQDVQSCDWTAVGQAHWRLVYQPLLESLA
jgi:glycosyltransferase involved in cell wall biosynthesis